MIGAPAPLSTSARSTVRKSIEYRVDLVVFGIEACSWSPENSMIPPTGGTTVRRCSSSGSGSTGAGWTRVSFPPLNALMFERHMLAW